MKKLPKYLEIARDFTLKIESGELEHGDRIPTEQELCTALGVGRMTVNRAMGQLADSGYIKRIPGMGSFVTAHNIVKPISSRPRSMTQDIINAGMTPGCKLVSYQVIRGSENPFIAKKLGLQSDEFMHYFVRLRTGDSQPVAISYTAISPQILPELQVTELEGSFNQYVAQQGLVRSHLRSEFTAALPTPEQEELLEAKGFALLKQNLLWYVGETPFEYTSHCFVGSRFSLSRDLNLIANSDMEPQYAEADPRPQIHLLDV